MGGLGVGSLLSKNLGLLCKWKWRFLIEENALWHRVISYFNGSDGGFGGLLNDGRKHGVWCDILRSLDCIENLDKGVRLKDLFPRLFALENNKDCLIVDRWKLIEGSWRAVWDWRINPRGRALDDLTNLFLIIGDLSLSPGTNDKWLWSCDATGVFKVRSITSLIQNKLLEYCKVDNYLLWNSRIPRKVNICVWRASLDRLPSRLNLQNRGKVWSWWQFDPSSSMSSVSVSDFARGNIGSLGNPVLRKIVHGVFLCVLWAIWRWRNNVCNAHPDRVNAIKTEDIFSLIQRLSLLWISKKCSLKTANWNQWTVNPRGCVP
ncbi:hypothetical protein Tco_0620668 [Tanacetum coccineum]